MLQGLNHISLFNIIRCGPAIVRLLLFFTLILFGYFTLTSAIIAHSVAIFAVVFVGARMLMSVVPLEHSNKIPMKKAASFGLVALVSQLIGSLNLRFDFYIADFFCGSEGLGQYSVAVASASILWQIPAAIASVLIPKLASSDASSAANITLATIRAYIILVVPIMLLSFVFGPKLIDIAYGTEFSTASNLFLVLLPGCAFFGVVSLTTSYFAASLKKPVVNTCLAGFSLVLNIILNMILIPIVGLTGVAWACTISYLVSTVVALFIFIRLSGLSRLVLLVPRMDDFVSLYKVFLKISHHTHDDSNE